MPEGSVRTTEAALHGMTRFVAQHHRPSVVADVDFAALSPYHRTLLAHDGLTTGVIESWWLEPITVKLVSQHEAPGDDPLLPWLWEHLLSGVGIGAALTAGKVETRRELLWYGRRGEAVASRAYRIFVGGLPAAVIQEDFLR